MLNKKNVTLIALPILIGVSAAVVLVSLRPQARQSVLSASNTSGLQTVSDISSWAHGYGLPVARQVNSQGCIKQPPCVDSNSCHPATPPHGWCTGVNARQAKHIIQALTKNCRPRPYCMNHAPKCNIPQTPDLCPAE